MARKSFLIRIDEEILDAVRHWADEELRSVNGHVEFLLRRALRESGRLPVKRSRPERTPDTSTDENHSQS